MVAIEDKQIRYNIIFLKEQQKKGPQRRRRKKP